LKNFFKAKAVLYYHMRIQPSEIENMPYYEMEITLEELVEILKQKNEAEKKAYDGQKGNQNTPDFNKYANVAKGIAGGVKMPSFSMPKMR
jgi:hypothetical protein